MGTEHKQEDKGRPFDQYIQWGLLAVAATCVFAAVMHGVWPERFDEGTAMFLALAVVALVVREIGKFKGFGLEFEKVQKDVQNLREGVADVEKKVDVIEAAAPLPGRTNRAAQLAMRMHVPEAGEAEHIWASDPNKGKFGDSPEANGRILRASIEPAAGSTSAGCRVTLLVESTDPAKPLMGEVEFHLHPTFPRPCRKVIAKGGVAKTDFTSWGAFTVGAVADNGETRLELDLVSVPGGTDKFYEW